jgi:hypothetical protein
MKNYIFLIFAFFSISQSYAGFQWKYDEKIAAETRCSDGFRQNIPRNRACLLGVTVYGDARSWQGINTTRNQAQTNCNTLCSGADALSTYCQNGCQFARAEDL